MRQVSRDGSNQYFLNKSEILLRDLVDFYAKARMGSRGLIVVTQGNSDMFIMATPAERREMIEEILGLREYQLKKSEAERKLKTSQINLDKVRALIEEIVPHLRSLKRQTARWDKRESMEIELRDLENQFYGSQWGELHNRINVVAATMQEHKKALPELEKHKHEAEEKQKRVEQSEPEGRAQLREIKNKVQQLFEQRSELQKEIGKLEAQIELEQRSDDPSMPAADELVQLLKRLKSQLQLALEREVDELPSVIEEILHEVSTMLGSMTPSSTEKQVSPYTKWHPELERIAHQLEELDGHISELKKKEKELEAHQEGFYQSFKQAVAEVEHAKEAIERWHDDNRQKVFEKERLEMRLDELKRQIVQAGRQEDEFINAQASGAPTDDSAERRIFRLRGDLASIGEVDQALVKEAQETQERHEFLGVQAQDLEKAVVDLRAMIKDLRAKIHDEFHDALGKINSEFDTFYKTMFGGGHAKLKLEQATIRDTRQATSDMKEERENPVAVEEAEEKPFDETEAGLEISLSLPRRRVSSLEMLSGGEKSLVGIAALFALISVSPPPFLVLDEIDAALDERNTRRFADMLKEFSKKSQFIVVTHNRATMEAADVLYGVTVAEDGSSKVLSLKLEPQAA